MRRWISIVLPLLLLSGCSSMNPVNWFGDEDNAEKPAELKEVANQIQPDILWERSIGSGTDDQRVKLVPQVLGNRLFVAERNGDIYALEANEGKVLWKTETGLQISGGAGAGNGLVLVGTSDAEVAAYDEASGQEKWRTLVSSEVLSVPAVSRGVVVVHTIDGKLFGLNTADGKQLWLYDRSIPVLTLHGGSSPVINDNMVICGLASGKLIALDLNTGIPVWETTITAARGRTELERMVDIDGDPLVVRDAVFVTTYQGEMAALIRQTGVVAWRRKLSAYSGLAADVKQLYAADAEGNVWAFEPRNSAAVWKNRTLQARQLSGPASVDGYVVVGDLEGYLHWLSPDDGRVMARIKVGSGPISTAPVVANGIAYVYGESGTLAAVRLRP